MLLEAKSVTLFIYRLLLLLSPVCVSVHQFAILDHYGSGGWGPPTPSSGPRWGPIPGSSSSTPGPPPVMDSPYRITCPVHSPYRFRFANGGPDYYGHQVDRLHGKGCSLEMTSSCKERHRVGWSRIRLLYLIKLVVHDLSYNCGQCTYSSWAAQVTRTSFLLHTWN